MTQDQLCERISAAEELNSSRSKLTPETLAQEAHALTALLVELAPNFNDPSVWPRFVEASAELRGVCFNAFRMASERSLFELRHRAPATYTAPRPRTPITLDDLA